jgi:hypothetical protein
MPIQQPAMKAAMMATTSSLAFPDDFDAIAARPPPVLVIAAHRTGR